MLRVRWNTCCPSEKLPRILAPEVADVERLVTAKAGEALEHLPVSALKGIGPSIAERVGRIGIRSIQDVLFHLPLRYQDRTRVVPIGGLRAGDQAVIEGEIGHAELKFGRRRSLLVHLADGTGAIILRFFHFSGTQQQALVRGTRLRCFGEVRAGPLQLEMVHPEYRRVGEAEANAVEETLTPIYPSTEGVQQPTWRRLTNAALDRIGPGGEGLMEWLPAELLESLRLPRLDEALRYLHRPPPDAPIEQLLAGAHPAQRRLAFEELLAHQLGLRRLRARQRRRPAPRLAPGGTLVPRLLDALPFRLTGAQERVWREIATDIDSEHPMLRLVQGDVGSGKTVVAALAALRAVEAGQQVALMAPTELLAEQHLRNFTGWLAPLGVAVQGLTGRLRAAARRDALTAIENGEAQVVCGTQALFQEGVGFASLGLVIVDEQHRFGVHQRLALHDKGARRGRVPHQLVMTATPIPRTLAMTAYADLDLSVIDELPPGRTPVRTVAIADTRRDEVVARVREACAAGRQAYWVCTLIEESEALQCQAAEDTAAMLAEAMPELRVGLVHGRLRPADKEDLMGRFKAGAIDLLVATTVIEVGVDVPNASLMVIENPERLGLAQLHQLRGRVGRGAVESHCVLLYHAPLGEGARERLAVMRETTDGFVIAQKDLELRGPGEVLGTRQTGEMGFRIADLLRDQPMIPRVQRAADLILERYPERVDPLIRRWVGDRSRYAAV
jgi:ATP-dependent DNA helicase RecG